MEATAQDLANVGSVVSKVAGIVPHVTPEAYDLWEAVPSLTAMDRVELWQANYRARLEAEVAANPGLLNSALTFVDAHKGKFLAGAILAAIGCYLYSAAQEDEEQPTPRNYEGSSVLRVVVR